MIPLYVAVGSILFIVLVFSTNLLLKNLSKTETNRRLGILESKADRTNLLLEVIAKKMGVDTDALKDESKKLESDKGGE